MPNLIIQSVLGAFFRDHLNHPNSMAYTVLFVSSDTPSLAPFALFFFFYPLPVSVNKTSSSLFNAFFSASIQLYGLPASFFVSLFIYAIFALTSCEFLTISYLLSDVSGSHAPR